MRSALSRRISLSAVLALGLALASCKVEAEDLVLLSAKGVSKPLLTDSRKNLEDSGRVNLPAGSSMQFYFPEPVKAEDAETAFIFSAESAEKTSGLFLDMNREKDKPLSSAVPISGFKELEIIVLLPPGQYSGFALRNTDKEQAASIRIRELKVGQASYATTIDGNKLTAFSGLLPGTLPRVSPGTAFFHVDTDGEALRKASGVFIEFGNVREEKRPRPVITFLEAGRQISAEIVLRPMPETLWFYFDALGFIPESVEISGAGNSLRLGLGFFDTKSRTEYPEPIPGDLGASFSYPQSSWRKKDLEVFRWSLFPEILIFNTADYAVQNKLFHRLAFFVEKKGFRGRLSADSEISNRHGWNAHNYRAEDLASFFNEAERTNFPLNQSERWLASYLTKMGVLQKGGAAYRPGNGGILSVSLESLPAHRRLLITHEAFHGIYYGIPEFRRLVKETWDAQSNEEKEFWKYFLSWMQYDAKDPYLVVNEFQAYLLQQPLRAVDEYFRKMAIPRILEKNPDRKESFDSLLTSHPDIFTKPARIFSEFLGRRAALSAGDVFTVFLRP